MVSKCRREEILVSELRQSKELVVDYFNYSNGIQPDLSSFVGRGCTLARALHHPGTDVCNLPLLPQLAIAFVLPRSVIAFVLPRLVLAFVLQRLGLAFVLQLLGLAFVLPVRVVCPPD